MGSVQAFFKLILSSEKMEIPRAFVSQMKGSLPSSVILRDKNKNLWRVDVARDGDGWFFNKGWSKFVRGNSIELGDFMTFEYKGGNLFDFKVLAPHACEKKEVEGSKIGVKEELEDLEMEEEVEEDEQDDDDVEEDEEEEQDDINYEDYDDDCIKREEEDEEEKQDDANDEDIHCVKQEEEEEDDDEYVEEDKEEKINNNVNNRKRFGIGTRPIKRQQKRKSDIPDYYGHDIFNSRLAKRPKNPYFVSRLRPPHRRNELYIPLEVIKDRNLNITEKLTLVDEEGGKWETNVKQWKDGRKWCTRGWKSLCNVNQIERDDVCICEFLTEAGSNKVLSILIRVVRGL